MLKILLVLGLLLGFSPARADNPVILEESAAKQRWAEMIVDSMTLDGMETDVLFADCGQVNAFYFYEAKTIVICNELIETVNFGTLRFIVAHEMAHAIIVQKDLPYTGSHEDAADELAAVYLYTMGMQRDILDTAYWFYGMRANRPDPWDDHTPAYYRAHKLACLYDGATGPNFDREECGYRFSRALRTWDRLLKLR